MPNSMENVDTSGLEPGGPQRQSRSVPVEAVIALLLMVIGSSLAALGVSQATENGWGLATLGGFWAVIGVFLAFQS